MLQCEAKHRQIPRRRPVFPFAVQNPRPGRLQPDALAAAENASAIPACEGILANQQPDIPTCRNLCFGTAASFACLGMLFMQIKSKGYRIPPDTGSTITNSARQKATLRGSSRREVTSATQN
ncbi:hypothetical protein GA829_01235 [Mesorhizobium sp. INR15]|nr:hypothetical protein GA829_01235 [Mesorhizobium sp. INR15]